MKEDRITFGEPNFQGRGIVLQDIMFCGEKEGGIFAPMSEYFYSLPLDEAQAGKVRNALPWCKLLESEWEGHWHAHYERTEAEGSYFPRLEEFCVGISEVINN